MGKVLVAVLLIVLAVLFIYVISNLVGRFFGFTKLEYLQFGEEVEKRP